MAVGVPVAFVGIVKGKSLVTKWWSGKKADSVSSLIELGETQMAAGTLSQALAANPNDPRLLRMWDDLLKQARVPASERVTNLRKLLEVPSATDEDRLRLADAYAAYGNWSESTQILEALPEAIRRGRESLTIEAGMLYSQGKLDHAEKLYRAACAAEPDHPESKRMLAFLDLDEPFEETRLKAKETLLGMTVREDEIGVKAMLNLAKDGRLTVSEALRLKDAASKNSALKEHELLTVMLGVAKAAPMEKDAIVSTQLGKAQGASLETRRATYRWLIDLQREDLVIRQIQPAQAAADGQLFLLLSEAYARRKLWNELRHLMTHTETPPLSKTHVALIIADCDLNTGSQQEGINRIKAAYNIAMGDMNAQDVLRVQVMADSLNLWEISIKCQEWLVSATRGSKLKALDGLYSRLYKTGDCVRMLDVLAKMSEILPDNADLTGRLAYLRLLSGQEIEKGKIDEASAACNAVHKLTEALYYYRLGDLKGLSSSISGLEQDLRELTPGQRIVAAALLMESGDVRRAANLRETLAPVVSDLLPEEQAFMRKLSALLPSS
jgi:tetratricopeptide (TPR) repeat protein